MKKFFRGLVTHFYILPVLALLMNLGACGTIMYNTHEELGVICMVLSIALVAVQPITFVAALLQRRWGIAVLAFILMVVTGMLTFISIIGIAVGQHHPPRMDEIDTTYVDTTEVVENIDSAMTTEPM
jgi:membrane-bound ClpP family serine protease